MHMIKSMTGFGQAGFDNGAMQISVEIKSLNSKFLDLNLRLPRLFAEREVETRNLISEHLERGKVNIQIEFQVHGDIEPRQTYQEDLFVAYFETLKRLADRVGTGHDKLFELALNSPEVILSKLDESSTIEQWEAIKECLITALKNCDQFRRAEGNSLESVLKDCIQVIREQLIAIEELDPRRVQKIRDRLRGNVVAFFGEEGFDTNRLEQEIIFYLEKLDITEEKVRLRTHLDYFIQIIKEPVASGKKLGFIAQEIGREINTIGSKANDAPIQKHVVVMKDELEKIKEQLNNIL